MQLKTIKEMIYLVNFVRAPPWVISILTESVPLWRGGHYSSSSHYRPSPLFTPQNLAVIQIGLKISLVNIVLLSKVYHAGQICQLFTEKYFCLWMELQYSVVFQQKKKALMDQAFVWKTNIWKNKMQRKIGCGGKQGWFGKRWGRGGILHWPGLLSI